MAKRKKKSTPKVKTVTKYRTKYKTRTKTVVAKAKRARRAAGERMGTKDIIAALIGAGVGGVGGSIAYDKMPDALPDVVKNGALGALGGFIAYKGLKKRSRLLMGLGLGAGAVAVKNVIGGVVASASGSEVGAPCLPMLSAPTIPKSFLRFIRAKANLSTEQEMQNETELQENDFRRLCVFPDMRLLAGI